MHRAQCNSLSSCQISNQQSHREGGDACRDASAILGGDACRDASAILGGDACRDASAILAAVAVKMSQSLSFSLTAQTSCIVQVRVDPL